MKTTFALIATVALIVLGTLLFLEKSSSTPAQTFGDINRLTNVTNTSVACGTSDTLVLATSSGRQYVAITNTSATPVYLALGTTAVGSNGIYLGASGGAFEINQDNLFTGAIHCIASSTAIVGVISK